MTKTFTQCISQNNYMVRQKSSVSQIKNVKGGKPYSIVTSSLHSSAERMDFAASRPQ